MQVAVLLLVTASTVVDCFQPFRLAQQSRRIGSGLASEYNSDAYAAQYDAFANAASPDIAPMMPMMEPAGPLAFPSEGFYDDFDEGFPMRAPPLEPYENRDFSQRTM